MNLQQFDDKIISITSLRRDIEALKKILNRNDEAVVMRNQDVLFVAVTPKKYQELQTPDRSQKDIEKAAAGIDRLRQKYGNKTKGSVSDYVIKMRDERITKWKK